MKPMALSVVSALAVLPWGGAAQEPEDFAAMTPEQVRAY